MRTKKLTTALFALALTGVLAGCQSSGNPYRSDVYSVNQLNQAQSVMAVNIVAINPAQIRVPNENEDDIQLLGSILGAVAGVAIGNQDHNRGSSRLIGGVTGGVLGGMAAKSMAGGNNTTVPGVQLIYRLRDGRLVQSTQVGRLCEFKLGEAIMVSPGTNQTRIQPNNPYGCGVPQQ